MLAADLLVCGGEGLEHSEDSGLIFFAALNPTVFLPILDPKKSMLFKKPSVLMKFYRGTFKKTGYC